MKILVCVKQVPDTTEIKIDPVKKTLIRDGVPSIVNPFDTYALEMAARIKDAGGASITILSMGPAQAESAIRQCLAVGGDAGYLVTDRAFGGSDTLATSYILSQAIRYIEKKDNEKFDIIFCGKQAIDGDTGQVGPEIAEHFGYAQVTYATEAALENDCLVVKRDTDEGYDRISVQLPAVVTVTKTSFEPRYPNIRSKLAATKAEIAHITLSELEGEMDVTRIGLKGSPTKVKKTFTPERNSDCHYFDGDNPALAAKQLTEKLSELKLI